MSAPDLILAVDVQYDDDAATGRVGAVWFTDWSDDTPAREVVFEREGIAPYRPGYFYTREMPCVLDAIAREARTGWVVVDGYVDLGPEHPGLGRYVHDACGLPVIGVAKSRFRDAIAVEVMRGTSARPLFVTAVGMPLAAAARAIGAMHGPHRHPTLLKRVDQLARCLADVGSQS